MKQKVLYKKYIKGTSKKAQVVNKRGLVCHLRKVIIKKLKPPLLTKVAFDCEEILSLVLSAG